MAHRICGIGRANLPRVRCTEAPPPRSPLLRCTHKHATAPRPPFAVLFAAPLPSTSTCSTWSPDTSTSTTSTVGRKVQFGVKGWVHGPHAGVPLPAPAAEKSSNVRAQARTRARFAAGAAGAVSARAAARLDPPSLPTHPRPPAPAPALPSSYFKLPQGKAGLSTAWGVGRAHKLRGQGREVAGFKAARHGTVEAISR